MINFNRVIAMVYRYTYSMRHNLDRLSDTFYWPALDLFLWGLVGIYFAKLGGDYQKTATVLLTGLVFWIVVWRAQYEINTNLLAEIWDKNLVNIFASPLKIQEWMASFIIFGFIKMLLSLAFSALIAFILFQYNIFIYGFIIIPVVTSLVLTGWAGGFLVAGILIRYGATIQAMAWAGVALLAPFSALFYPLSILPAWAQKIAVFVPPSYVFEAMRDFLFTKSFSYDKLLVSFILNIIYLVLGISFFIFMFNRSRRLGLGRLI